MKINIIIPAHNEAEFIELTLESLATQTHLPNKIIVVDDGSTDNTAKIVKKISLKYPFISLVKNATTSAHEPGSKIVNAFYKGYYELDGDFDVICKFDADLIFPENYLESIVHIFRSDKQIGMAAGFCSVLKNNKWVPENLTNKDHIRGALKAYRKHCFISIGELKPAMGWDTADELLARYHDWKIVTDEQLLVKHLRPTGKNYFKNSARKQGEAFYRLHYSFWLCFIASAKLAVLKGKPFLFFNYMYGFFKAQKEKKPFLVSPEEGAFIRNLRWKNMKQKLF